MAGKDYYDILTVAEDADALTIKKAFRKLAQRYHPDRNPDNPEAEEKFKEIMEAYETLSNARRRRQYDAKRKGGSGNGFDFFTTGSGNRYRKDSDGSFSRDEPEEEDDNFMGDGLGDLFSRIFGGGSEDGPRHSDIEVKLKLSFDQALRGGKTSIKLPDDRTVRLTIPKGVRDGFKIRIKNRGREKSNGERGHLYVTFNVEESTDYRRVSDDLYLTEIVNMFEAALGTTRQVANAYGEKIKLHIPPGTQPGEKLRLRGQGVRTNDYSGDLYVEIEVEIPRELSNRQKVTLRTLARRAGLYTD